MVHPVVRTAPGLLALALIAPSAGAQSPPPATAPAPTPAPAAAPAPAATPAPAKAAPVPAWKPPSKAPKLPPPPPPPDVPARLWMIAPGPREPWTMRIDNEGPGSIRVPADIRLLSFEIDVPSNDPKNPKKKPTTYKCSLPDSLRPGGFPERRALLLGPGQSYIESFDPRLFCFGKNAAALVGTAVVRTRFGWDPPPKWSLAAKKPPAPPFAAEGTDSPATTTPLRQLQAPTLVLSFGTPPAPPPGAAQAPSTGPQPPDTAAQAPSAQAPSAGPQPPDTAAQAPSAQAPSAGAQAAGPAGQAPSTPGEGAAAPSAGQPGSPSAPAAQAAPVDANAPRLAVKVPAYVDASAPRSASVTVTVENAGGRPMLAALRPRMVGFQVAGPDRTVTCPSWPATNAVPRDAYRQYKPGGTTSFTILLAETCPDGLFTRPGLYRVSATMDANERGAELDLDAFTGKATTADPALLRLLTAREPFYRDPPKAVPTPKPEAPADDAEQAP